MAKTGLLLEKQVKKGIELGIVKFISNTQGNGTVCQIGDDWFYFGGETADFEEPEQYLKDNSIDDIAESIVEAILDFKEYPEGEDEYEYLNLILKDIPVDDDMETCCEFKCPIISECNHYHKIYYNVWGEGIETPKECPRWKRTDDLPF